MQNNDNPSFFDSKTIIAISAVALVYFGWQTYLQKKYPQYGKIEKIEQQKAEVQATTIEVPAVKAELSGNLQLEEKVFEFSNKNISFLLTSNGMGLKGYTVNNYQDKSKNNIKLGSSGKSGLFEMRLVGQDAPVRFNVTEQSLGHYIGIATVGGATITREMRFDDKTSSFVNTISITKPGEEFKEGIAMVIGEDVHVAGSTSFLFPSYEHQDFFVVHGGGKHETVTFSSSEEDIKKEISGSTVLSLSSQYFAAAILDKSEIIPDVKLSYQNQDKSAVGEFIYKPNQLKETLSFKNILYAGPKSIDSLKMIDPELAQIINFGFFGFIAQPLLYVMKAFHTAVGNWGFAIILLTLLVRLCVLPFNVMSFKSMKAMQKIQPAIQKLREKYKDDAVRLNQEMMALMKENGANPIGGCLPMLLQIPVFFALYQVIGSSVELYNSPFVGWIHDLSSYDPYYVLPVLMSVFMFIQQKITPSTMDPVQAKIMAFLPIVFSLFMLQLPSGLTLYMVVSTLFGIIQQYLIMREKATA